MRMMLKVRIPVEAGNAAIQGGDLQKAVQHTLEGLKAEAAYFIAEDGLRTALIFFDMVDSADIPVIAEPLFQAMNAKLDLIPAMNVDDLLRGLSKV